MHPYLMTQLRPSSAWFDDYYATRHSSQASHVALMSGRFTGCERADGFAWRDDVENLFRQLDGARLGSTEPAKVGAGRESRGRLASRWFERRQQCVDRTR